MLGRVRQILSKRSERVTSSRANPSPPRATATSGSTSDTDTHEIERHSLNLRRTNEETAVEFGRDCERPSDLRQRNTDEPPYGLTILVDQPPGQINSVDIVAIHGLNGHREKTWTDGASGVNWLAHADCLRNDIPCARVLSFGYNSASFFSRGDANIQDFASELLAALKSSRNSSAEKERPIIFICHSLGGLVFKQVRCATAPSRNTLTKNLRPLSERTSKTDFMHKFYKTSKGWSSSLPLTEALTWRTGTFSQPALSKQPPLGTQQTRGYPKI